MSVLSAIDSPVLHGAAAGIGSVLRLCIWVTSCLPLSLPVLHGAAAGSAAWRLHPPPAHSLQRGLPQSPAMPVCSQGCILSPEADLIKGLPAGGSHEGQHLSGCIGGGRLDVANLGLCTHNRHIQGML